MKFILIERALAVVGAVAVCCVMVITTVGVVRNVPLIITSKCGDPSACETYTNTGKGPGIEGNNTHAAGQANGFGVLGTSSSTDGVHGTSTHAGSSGVTGIMTGTSSNNGNGVYGQSSDSSGKYAAIYAAGDNSGTNLFQGYNSSTNSHCTIDPKANLTCSGALSGTATNGNGVSGISTVPGNSGVAGFFTTGGSGFPGYGVYGASVATFGTGVYGSGAAGVVGFTGGGSLSMALGAEVKSPSADIFYGYDDNTDGVYCQIDGSADLQCTGSITGGAELRSQLTTSTRRHVLGYASESATPTIEDLGAARLRDGIANVAIPADFASVMDRNNPYYVFLTPMGDTHGLYVNMQDASGFQVRENMHGRSNVAFEYRIIAVPLGAKNVRLPTAPKPPPRPKLRAGG